MISKKGVLKIKLENYIYCFYRTVEDSGADDQAIIYDIYLPNKKFRKSDPGTPHFRTCIVEWVLSLLEITECSLLVWACKFWGQSTNCHVLSYEGLLSV